MTIAIDISQIAYQGTGVASYTKNLVKSLLQEDRENNYILFGISLRQLGALNNFYEEIKGINDKVSQKFFPLPQSFANFLWNKLHRIPVDKFLGKVDIFHSSDWIQPPTQAKKITTIHDMIIYKFPDVSHEGIITTQKRRLVWVKKECDMVITDSFATKKDIVDILHLGEDKIEVIYPGIGKEFKRQSDEEIVRIRQKYGLADRYLLSVGTLEPRKNLKKVVEAFEIFRRHPLIKVEDKPIELVIGGKVGWEKNELFGVNVRHLGFVSDNDLPALYSGARLFLYPSLYEGFGLPVIEAMACGCPVISSARGSLKEVVSDSGVLVDPEETEDIAIKMVQLFVDRDMREKLVDKGLKHAASFTWVRAAKILLNIYDKLYV